MNKSSVIGLTVILLSFFVIRTTDQTNHYEVHSGHDSSLSGAIFDNTPVSPPPYIADIPIPPKVLGDSTALHTYYYLPNVPYSRL